jgi:chemotaxis protein CheC
MKLTEIRRDALVEVANIGMSRAAKQLSVLINDDIDLSAPEVEVLPLEAALAELYTEGADDVVAVSQNLRGGLEGRVYLLFRAEDRRLLVRALMGTVSMPPDVAIGYFESEAISELGNIIISTCVNIFSQFVRREIELTVPTYAETTAAGLFSDDVQLAQAHAVILRTTLRAAQRNARANFLLVLTLETLMDLLKQLETSVGGPGADE